MTSNVIPFPPRLRVIATPMDGLSPRESNPVLIDHNGQTYRLTDLLARLSSAEMAEVEATAPRSAQAVWDEVVRRWPALAEEIVAGQQL